MQAGLKALARLCLSLALFVGACLTGRAQTQVKTDELPADTLIVMQRGACERHCAVYKLMLFSDGSVIFDGRAYVRKPGLAKTTISRQALKTLLDDAQGFGLFEMKPRYDAEAGCEVARSDAPQVVLTVSAAGKVKTIVHFLGCAGLEPERLKQWEASLDAATGAAAWLK